MGLINRIIYFLGVGVSFTGAFAAAAAFFSLDF